MTCHTVTVGSSRAIVCGPTTRCSACRSAPATLLCDWKTAKHDDGTYTTCDAALCARCAFEPAAEKHLCPTHARAWAKHPKAPAPAYVVRHAGETLSRHPTEHEATDAAIAIAGKGSEDVEVVAPNGRVVYTMRPYRSVG